MQPVPAQWGLPPPRVNNSGPRPRAPSRDNARAGWPVLESRPPQSRALLSQWGVAVGTLVGWQASLSMMGLSTDMFFLMMGKMMWLRDVVSLLIKGLLYGGLPAAICCYEGLRPEHAARGKLADAPLHPSQGMAPALTLAVFRAAFLSFLAILIVNATWFILVYHAVPFYGPTLLAASPAVSTWAGVVGAGPEEGARMSSPESGA